MLILLRFNNITLFAKNSKKNKYKINIVLIIKVETMFYLRLQLSIRKSAAR